MNLIEGIYPAVLTAFDENGRFDPNNYRRFIDHLYAKGVDGLYACGVGGEGLLMSLEEREFATETAIEASHSKGKVIVHVGCATTADAVRLARHAAKRGALAVGCLAPYVGSFGPESLMMHFRAVADAAQPLPTLIYYTPGTAPSLSDYFLVEQLMKIPNIAGLKFTATNASEFAVAMFQQTRNCTVLSGVDEMFVAALFMGAHGAISSFLNLVPDWFAKIYSLAKQQQWEQAKSIQARLIGYIRIVERYPFISAMKHVVHWQGFDCGEARLPQQSLSAAQATELRGALASYLGAVEMD